MNGVSRVANFTDQGGVLTKGSKHCFSAGLGHLVAHFLGVLQGAPVQVLDLQKVGCGATPWHTQTQTQTHTHTHTHVSQVGFPPDQQSFILTGMLMSWPRVSGGLSSFWCF